MKKIVFYAHDPGSYDVIYPVFQMFKDDNSFESELICEGAAGEINKKYSFTEGSIVKIIKKYIEQDNLVAFITGRNWGIDYEVKVISMCKEVRVSTFVILDFWCNYALKIKDSNDTIINPDYYIVMDDLAKNEAIQEGIPLEIIHVLGQPGLDKLIANKNQCDNKVVKDNKKILFLSQPLSKIYGETLGYTEKSVLDDCIRVIDAIPNMNLDIKFHPKDDMELVKKYSKYTVGGELMELLPKYDLIIGMSTMGLLHAVLMGVPAISYQPNIKDKDLCITNKLELTNLLRSYEELESYICKHIDDFSNNYNNRILDKYLWSDGKSAKRVYEFIRNNTIFQ